jgi:small subunit ribosomal protein S7
MYGRFNVVQSKTQEDPLKVFKTAVDNVKPSLEVKSRRVGGSNYQVPVEVNSLRAARRWRLRWIISSPASGPERPMVQKLAPESDGRRNLAAER